MYERPDGRYQAQVVFTDESDVEKIEAVAEKRGISVSQLLREAARKEIQREETNNE